MMASQCPWRQLTPGEATFSMNSSRVSDPQNEIRFHCDPEGRLEQVSLGWVQFVGMSVEEVHGKSWLAFVASDQRAKLEGLWKAAVEGRGPLEFTADFVGREGDGLPVTGRLLPCLDTFGDLLGYAAQVTRADAGKEAAPTDAATRVLDTLGMKAVVVSSDGRLATISRSARAAFESGAEPGAQVVRLFPELAPWKSTVVELSRTVDGVLTLPHADSSRSLTLMTTQVASGTGNRAASRPANSGAGDIARVSEILILVGKAPDLETRRAHSALEVAGLMAGAVASQLNNSLAIVDGTAELLGEGVEGDEASQVAAIRESVRDGIDLTERLASLTSSAPSEVAPVSLSVLMSRLQPLLRIAAGRQVVVEPDLPHDLPRLEACGAHLERMLITLAVEMRKLCRKGRFAVTARAEVDRVILSLELDSADLDDVTWLEPVVARMGSAAGGEFRTGTSACELSFVRVGRSEVQGAVQSGTGSEPPLADKVVRREGVRVLVAEDERVTRDLISRRLRGAGYAVTVAADGEQALDLFDALDDEVDIVVTDILMPNKDGVSLARELRSRSPQLKLLMISGQKSAADRLLDREVLLVGTPVMQKPFSSEALVHEIRELLEHPAEATRPAATVQSGVPEEN